MKIVFVIGSLDAGGAEKQIILLSKALSAAGHEVQVFTIAKLYWNGNYTHICDMENLKISVERAKLSMPRKFLETISFSWHLFRFLKISKPDVMHAWLIHAYITALPIAYMARVPVRISARRGLWSGIGGRIWVYLSKFSNLFATHFTANSGMVAQDASLIESIPLNKIAVISNIVERDGRRSDVLIQPPMVIVVGNLIYYKGHLDLLDAIKLSDTDLRFLFVGQGPMLAKLRLKAKLLGIETNVEFVGFKPRPIELMLKSQFGILPSHSEGFPNVILEAHSIGLPMIATRVGGVPEIIQDHVNGILVSPHAPEELSTAISWMSENPIERHRMSLEALSSIKRFDSRLITKEYIALYATLVEGV